MNKKAIIPMNLILLVTLIAGTLTIGVYLGLLPNIASIVGYDIVWKQDWGHVWCWQHFDYDIKYTKYLDQQNLFKCNDYTNECFIEIVRDRDGWMALYPTGYYRICNLDGSSCSSKIKYTTKNTADKIIFTIDVGKSAKFDTGIFVSGKDQTKITKKAKTFRLVGEENGKIYTTKSCVLSSELRTKVPTDGRNEIPFDDYENYMIGWTQVATKTYSYSGQEVVCQSRAIYEIDERAFKDGQTRKLQGERIKYVECCPFENNCGENFEWIPDKVDECYYSSECPNGGDPYGISQIKARQFSCIDGSCVSRDFEVECTSTAVCIAKYGEGYVCDKSPANWGKCVPQDKPHYCGDGVCDIGESYENCPDDCEIECAEGETLVTVTKQVNCFIGFPLYMGCEEWIEKKCVKPSPWGWLITLGIIAFVILIYIVFRGFFKKIPYLGRFLP